MDTAMTYRGKTGFPFRLFTCFIISIVISFPAIAHNGQVLTGYGAPTIDGTLSQDEWNHAGTVDFSVNIPGSTTVTGTLYVMNDGNNLYLAIEFPYTTSPTLLGNTAGFAFDNDHGGGTELQSGDDNINFSAGGAGFSDLYTSLICPDPQTICAVRDTDSGGTKDGSGAFSNDGGGITVYEFSHPLKSADDTHDFSLTVGDTIGFRLFITVPNADNTIFPGSIPDNFGDIYIDTDTDNDGIGNYTDTDDDNDGVPDVSDAFPLNPDETQDTDNDGMGDNFENTYGLDPSDPADAEQDPDGDGLTNLQEFVAGRNPILDERKVVPIISSVLLEDPLDTDGDGIPDSTDTDDDGDGIPDDYELAHGLNPLYAGDAGQDLDGDGLTNLEEYLQGTDINVADTDGDGVSDGVEVAQGRNPLFDERGVLPVITSILLGD